MIALDASALLAFLFREAGHEEVERLIPEGCISAVNLAEVLGRFTRDGHNPVDVLRRLLGSGLEIVSLDASQSILAAAFLPLVRSRGLSLGDRACLALAASRNIPALTADRAWGDLEVGVDIRLIR